MECCRFLSKEDQRTTVWSFRCPLALLQAVCALALGHTYAQVVMVMTPNPARKLLDDLFVQVFRCANFLMRKRRHELAMSPV